MKMDAMLGFPAVLKFNINELLHLPEDRIQQLAFQHCISTGLRPRVIRYIVSEAPNAKAVDVQWHQMVQQLGLKGLDLAVAEPIQGGKTKDIDIIKTAEHYGLRYRDIRVRLYHDAGAEYEERCSDEDEAP